MRVSSFGGPPYLLGQYETYKIYVVVVHIRQDCLREKFEYTVTEVKERFILVR